MPDEKSGTRIGWMPLLEAGAAAVGTCLFALFAHRSGLWTVASGAGLVVAAGTLIRSLRSEASPGELFGLSSLSPKVIAYLAVSCAMGTVLGTVYRNSTYGSLLPSSLTPFAFVAALIGGTEELLFRGYIQGRMRVLGTAAAVVLAAACHTAYKTALFVFPPTRIEIDYLTLVTCTFLGGLTFGALRELSNNVVPALLAHALFDVVVYGDRIEAPWWVWS